MAETRETSLLSPEGFKNTAINVLKLAFAAGLFIVGLKWFTNKVSAFIPSKQV